MERLTWERNLGGFADVGLCDGVTEGAAICRLAAYEDTGLEPERVVQLKEILEIFHCGADDPAQLKELCVKPQSLAQAEQAGRQEGYKAMREIDLSEKCGSCKSYRPIAGTAHGSCLKQRYGKDVVHDPEHPYRDVPRSRIKCRLYEEAAKGGENGERGVL